MTTPAERLRRALPPGPLEPGTRDADTAAVLDALDTPCVSCEELAGELADERHQHNAARAALTEREVDYQAALAALEALEAVRDAAALRGETL